MKQILMNEQFVYGLHAVSALLLNPYRRISRVFISEERHDQKIDTLLSQALKLEIPVERLALQTMNQRFKDVVHQGIVAIAKPMPDYGERDIPTLLAIANTPSLILILDGVTDPHNLGACLRSANAAGVDFVITPKDKNASITPVVTKVACGAAETTPLVRVTNLVRALELLKEHGIWIYGAAGESEHTIYHLDAKVPLALIMGAEGKGMRRLTREHCDQLFSLPMSGSVSSLNVSVAAGVSLYEVVRQRLS
jgi:23S rRNA (guanosine2251-2'-O)-methyltransferase